MNPRDPSSLLDPTAARLWAANLLLEAADRARAEPNHAKAARALCRVVRAARLLYGLGLQPGEGAGDDLGEGPPSGPRSLLS